MARFNCQMPFCHKDKKHKHIFSHQHIHTFWHLEFVCILLLEAIISLAGKKYCCVFVVYFCAFPPLDCPLVLPHPLARTQSTHVNTTSYTDSWWLGTSINPLSTQFKELIPELSHDLPRTPTTLLGGSWGRWTRERAVRQKEDYVAKSLTGLLTQWCHFFSLMWPLLIC